MDKEEKRQDLIAFRSMVLSKDEITQIVISSKIELIKELRDLGVLNSKETQKIA